MKIINKLIIAICVVLLGIGIGTYVLSDTADETQNNAGQEYGNEAIDPGNENYSEDENQERETGFIISEALQSDIDAGYLILVNREFGLERDYSPDDLAGIRYYASDRTPEARFMRATAAEAFHNMVEEARRYGIEFVMTTAFRTYAFQSVLYNNHVANHGQAAADRFSARPGHSEHQTGLAVDISAASVNYRLTVAFADTDEGRWIADNAFRFGFISRYPDGTEDITGFQFEPWHLRYVGLPAAEYIHTQGIVLEEYLYLLENL